MNNSNLPVKGVLFDLDGTLLDTAPDIVDALNLMRKQKGLPPLPLAALRPYVGHGVKAMLKMGFDIDETHPNYQNMSQDLFNCYEKTFAHKTTFFPDVLDVLLTLDQASIAWGIVTNKPTRFAYPLLERFDLIKRATCLVCGDTLAKKKPDPDPILYAAAKMQLETSHILYIGDADIDMIASQKANMRALVALYGYIHHDQDPYQWHAIGYLNNLKELIPWLQLPLPTSLV